MPAPNRTRSSRPRRQAASSNTPAQPTVVQTAPPPPPPQFREERRMPQLERIGDILRRKRLQRGDELQQIADYLCIRKDFLTALEESAYDELPADAYAIGFLRSYANYLGFDGAEAINIYRQEMSGRRRKPALILPTPIAEGRTPSPLVMISAAVVAIVIYALWYGLSNTGRAAVSVPPSLPSTASVPTGGIALAAPAPNEPISAASSAANATSTLIPATTAAQMPADAPPAASRLAIRAEKETWVVVNDSKGNAVFDQVMKPGDTFPLPETQGLKLTTGNSGGIVLVLDGKDLPKFSRDSGIMHDIPLDIEKLKTGKSKS